MTVVAIHQPNYVPWLGYFWKIARADVFVLLDDVQYSKGSYINRTRILGAGSAPRWLSVPVSAHLGDAINRVRPAAPSWPQRHLDILRPGYRRARTFTETWPEIASLYEHLPESDLAGGNRLLIERLCDVLALPRRFVLSSSLVIGDAVGDDRLVRIIEAVAPGGTYLSGRGGRGYQDERKFRDAGLRLVYTDFTHPEYTQWAGSFVSGLSILDALFHCGRIAVSGWLRRATSGAGAFA